MYKFSMPVHENVTAEQQSLMGRGGRLKAAHRYAGDVWAKLVEHARYGECTCHLRGGEVHVLAACVDGHVLYDEYLRAVKLLEGHKHAN